MAMRLFYSSTSPFVRKVLIVAKELSLDNKIEIVLQALNPTATENLAEVSKHNPLAKIPTLAVEGRGDLYGSQVICQYLTSLTPEGEKILPSSGFSRFETLTRESLADGCLEALLQCRFETALRPVEKQWSNWIDGQMGKVSRSLDEMEHLIQTHKAGQKWDLGDIAILTVLGYLELRFASLDWRQTRPSLAAWYAEALKRDSVSSTVHK
ncbi:glutathione S-transferase domain-containing protein [Polychytrium aggregatum]|uniref:glutathione S-transferase domain-containing protein n=1 Tax=Polychytrium aggregatum TaxID=110093 RepID=UPI0022FE7054|nr:glutathione S-transferase domain-containing protein [Polychytrium aggregatum]KAI9206809.1 glutathione S-transferase domain-containing protein [Polychytrium aggregatum]